MASTTPLSAPPPSSVQARPVNNGFWGFGADGPTFLDVLDVINPLHHIPIISTIYRAVTSDIIDPIPRLIGGALFGGLIGAASSLVNVIVEEITGEDIGGHVAAFVEELFEGSEATMVASARSAEPPFPIDKTELYFPAPPPGSATMVSASRRYGESAALSSPRSGTDVDIFG